MSGPRAVAAKAGRKKPSAKAAPATSTADRKKAAAVRELAKSWGAFFKGKQEDAVKFAAPLTKLSDRSLDWIVVEAVHVQARAYWAHGGSRGQAMARQLWGKLGKLKSLDTVKVRQNIAKALELEATGDAGKLQQAIGILEGIVRTKAPTTATAEASIDLARLYSSAKRFDDAETTLKAVGPWIKAQLLLEAPKEIAPPFAAAVQAAMLQLKYDRDEGKEQFAAAEKLRKAEKWREAAAAYQAIVKDLPATDYAAPSELHIGHCLMGLQQPAAAVKHWEKFIQAGPAGPWRGQAYVELIDLYLEQLLDLTNAGKYVQLAGGSLPAALANEKAAESWQDVALDVHLRIGVVFFAQGKGPAAAEALEKGLAGPGVSKEARAGLTRLIEVAKANQPLLPQTVRDGGASGAAASRKASQASTALALAMVYQLSGRKENAEAMLARVLPPPLRPKAHEAAKPVVGGVTAEQSAFAAYCQARLHAGRKDSAPARALAETAMKTAPKAAWHDATLYLLATLVDRDAQSKFGRPTKITDPKTNKPKSPDALTPAEQKTLRAAETTRAAALLKARAAALPYYRELTNKHPASPLVEPSLYHAAILLYDTEQFKESLSLLARFTEHYPKSPYAGDAYVKQIDIALERTFDLALAKPLATAAAVWARDAPDLAVDRPALPLWLPIAIHHPGDLRDTIGRCFFRAAMVAYLSGDSEQAVQMLDAAGPVSPPRELSSKVNLERIGLYFLIKAIRSGKAMTDSRALDAARTDGERLAIQLGDLYLTSGRPEQADKVLSRVANGDPVLGPVSRDVRGYAILQLAVALDRQRNKRPQALDCLKRLTSREYRGTYWGGYGLFRLAVFTYNQTQDAKGSLPLYEEMIANYPDHPKAELARAYYCFNAVRAGEIGKARQAFETFLRKYPKSDWVPSIRQFLKEAAD